MVVDPHWKSLHRGWHSRGYLPHFDMPGQVQSLTFRLADSLSAHRLAELRQQYPPEKQAKYLDAVEGELDSHAGRCWLRDPAIATLVENALLHFDGQRYRLLCWVIMPNHVHCVIALLPGWPVESILHSWKSFTAKAANKLLGRTGQFWQEEYFDRAIRDVAHLEGVMAYIHYNPVKAGLCAKMEGWRWSSFGRSIDMSGIV